MNYDPNLLNGGRMAKQEVKLTFAVWDYRKEMTVTIGGNCSGLSIISSAVRAAYDELPTIGKGRYERAEIELTRENGDTCACEDEDLKGDDWLADMLIKAEIVSIKPEEEE